MNHFYDACRYMDDELKNILYSIPSAVRCNAVEIVLKAGTVLYVISQNNILFINPDGSCTTNENRNGYIVSASQIRDILLRSSGYSLSAHRKEIEQGFISLGNGCRMTIGSNENAINGSIINPALITTLRIRIARNVSVDTSAFFDNGEVVSSLLVGQPASGKTTILRNIARDLAVGKYSHRYRVCVIDERNEIYPTDYIKPAGVDVLTGTEKHISINRAVRLCMPQVIICDEIGTLNEAKEILHSLNSGVMFICSMHANSFSELQHKECYQLLYSQCVFKRSIILQGAISPGQIKEIRDFEVCKD